MSGGTQAEALIVADGRNIGAQMAGLIQDLDIEISPLDAARAHLVAQAYRRWGKGYHAARLNFGDCFAYSLAIELDCPLLYVGDDFRQTDVKHAL